MIVDEHRPSPNGVAFYPHGSFGKERQLLMPRMSRSDRLLLLAFFVCSGTLSVGAVWLLWTLLGLLWRVVLGR